jgi:RimJ/RimL family protein N-acetyltransferase
MVPVSLTAEEFKTIHNALCDLGQINKPEVQQQVEIIRGALEGAYAQERQIMDQRYDHYSQVKKDLGLNAIWSITEVDNLSDNHPYEDVQYVSYKDHWGKGIMTKTI